MNFPDWLRPPRHALVMFAGVTLLPAAALLWLGWDLLEQDRGLERQQIQDQLERSADRVAVGLQRELDALERRLPTLLTAPLPGFDDRGAVVVRLTTSGVEAEKGVPLVYVPITTPASDPADHVWQHGEALEFQQHDLSGAASAFLDLTTSGDPAIRGGAWLRVARVRRKSGPPDAAVDAYRSVASIPTFNLRGEPSDLRARRALCALLAELGRKEGLAYEAASLSQDLARGHWRIDRPTYLFYRDEVRQWAAAPSGEGDAEALAASIDSIWHEWQSARRPGTPWAGRRSAWIDGRPLLLVWRGDEESLVALAAASTFIDAAWARIWLDQRASVFLADADGHRVLGSPAAPGVPDAVRTGPDTRLPWTLRVASADPSAGMAAITTRRRLLLATLALVVVLILATGSFVMRTVQRELAVARLQADFVSAVSHEFRTPLTSLTHLTTLLRSDHAPPDDRRRQYYDALARETDRLRRFVETLLDFGRMEAGAARYRLDPIDPALTVASLVDEFKADAAAGRHAVTLTTNGPVPPIRADREAIGRAIWNLLENAAKYSPEDAPITVEVARQDAAVAVRVADRGPGVPVAEQQQIFRKFFRGAAARQSAVKGTGVGLAMAQHIVRAHGGQLRLESEVGVGSTFTIVLPASVDDNRRGGPSGSPHT